MWTLLVQLTSTKPQMWEKLQIRQVINLESNDYQSLLLLLFFNLFCT